MKLWAADQPAGPAGNAKLPPAPAADEQPVLSQELLVHLKRGTDVQAFARARGLTVKRTLLSDDTMHVLKASSEQVASEQMAALRRDNTVVAAYLNLPSRNIRTAFVPNDPFFQAGNPGGFSGQWHLIYEAQPQFATHVQGAWNRDLTGAGVIIGICDDGVETTHPDLSPNYVAAESYDFVRGDPVPDPVNTDDNHGTSVAGVAAARGGNGIGVTGAAPLARLAGLQLPFGAGGTDDMFVDATKYHSFGANRNIRVKNHSYGVSAPFIAGAAQKAAFADSAAAGTIHCLAAGNDRPKNCEDSNKKSIQSSPHVIVVAALASSGLFASYSCFGANVMLTAPSSSFRSGEFGITTTDRTAGAGYNPGVDQRRHSDNAYTSEFGGTSSASPLAAGIMALGVHANPNLNVRLAKHLQVRSCDVIDANDSTETSDGGWKTNAAGFHFNQNYGFGLIDADEFTQLARQYSGVTPLQTAGQTVPVSVNAAIPDNGEISRTFTIDATTPLEEVEVYLKITHAYRGDLEAYLQSPRGTRSRLFAAHGQDNGTTGVDWTFVGNAFWGENPAGTWQLTIKDRGVNDIGTWVSYQFTARMGEPVPVSQSQPPTIASFSPASGPIGTRVTITGTKLDQVTAVRFNGVNATFTIDSSTQVSATVPSGATTGPVTVAAPGGTGTSTGNFTVTAEPSITSFSPPSGSVGTRVTVYGASFTGATAVRFSGVDSTFTIDSATQISATVPGGAASGRITVATPNGTASSPANFEVSAAPVISSFSPASGAVGTTVTIEGANFTGATAVRFNGQDAIFTVVSSSRITVTVPNGATSGPLTVVTPNGTATSAGTFSIAAPPAISNLIPDSAPVGAVVAISGSGFLGVTAVRFNGLAAIFTVDSAAQISATVPNGATTGPVTVTTPAGTATSSSSFTVISGPANDLFANALTLAGNSGMINSANVGATRENSEPRHASNLGGKSLWYSWTAPSAGTWVFHTVGSSYDTLLAVYVGSSVGALTTIAGNDDGSTEDTSSALQFLATAGVNYRIAVDGYNNTTNDPAQAAEGRVVLIWQQISIPPMIASFAPASGVAGTIVTLRGSNFLGTTVVRFNGVNAASFNVFSDEQITATAPAGVTTGPLSVVTPAGTVSSAASFTALGSSSNDNFANAQAISGNAGQRSGSTGGATKETGEPFHAGNSGGRSVWFAWTAPANGLWTFDTSGSSFDTLLAIYTGTSLNALTLVAANDDSPDSTDNSSRVSFDAVGGTTYRVAVDGYVGLGGDYVLNWALTPIAPRISGFTPASGPVGSSVIIEGANFTGATAVRFGSLEAVFTINSGSQLSATVPLAAKTGPITVTTPSGSVSSTSDFVVTTAASNDAFASARLISGSAAFVVASTIGASKEPGERDHGGNTGGHSVWFRWTAPSNGTWVVDLSGSGFDTLLGIYTGTSLATLSEVAGDDDSGEDAASRVTGPVIAGTTYFLAVDGYGGASGTATLRLYPASGKVVLYSTGFEPAEGFSIASPLAGQGGWEKFGSGGNGIVDEYFDSQGQQAWIGVNPPDFDDGVLLLWPPLNHRPDIARLPVLHFTVDMAVVDSDNGFYDDFEWVLFAQDGTRLFTLNFNNSNLGIYYQLQGDAASYQATGFEFENDLVYRLTIRMDFAANRWSAFLDDTPVVTGQAITSSGALVTVGDMDAVWVIRDFDAGNNSMVFDNYEITAEPNAALSILLQPQNQTVAAGQAAAFAVIPSGPEPFTYEWRWNGIALPYATLPVLLLEGVEAGDAGQYSCLVLNVVGSLTTTQATLTVTSALEPPTALRFLSDATLRLINGAFQISLTGLPASGSVVVSASSNLVNWLPIFTNTQPVGVLNLSDPVGTRSPRFYRAQWQP